MVPAREFLVYPTTNPFARNGLLCVYAQDANFGAPLAVRLYQVAGKEVGVVLVSTY